MQAISLLTAGSELTADDHRERDMAFSVSMLSTGE
jgi:hypothetical protein